VHDKNFPSELYQHPADVTIIITKCLRQPWIIQLKAQTHPLSVQISSAHFTLGTTYC